MRGDRTGGTSGEMEGRGKEQGKRQPTIRASRGAVWEPKRAEVS